VVPIPKVFRVRPKATRTAFCLKIAESTEALIEAGGASNADPLKALVDDMRKAIGAAREIRTPDPIITNDVLYQLSYCGPVGRRAAGDASRTAPLSMPVFPILAIRPTGAATAQVG
jgi:hypothetical protein